MSFEKVTQSRRRRKWTAYGFEEVGKTTFGTRMAGPILVVDADHRIEEVAGLAEQDIYRLSSEPADHVDPQRIAQRLKENMPGSGIQTIMVDSLTAIISPLIAKAMLESDEGKHKNHMTAHKRKAMAMRLLQDGITGCGTDVLWIYHLRHGLDGHARKVEIPSIPQLELVRLRRSLNMELRFFREGDKRGIVVEWARHGRYPLTLWDETGSWLGMPERIEEAVYGGLTQSEMDMMEKTVPASFRGSADAIAWGFDQGCFRDALHAQNAYEQLKREKAPATAAEMWVLWIEEVQKRVAARERTDE